jgi:hypothetical protein
MSKKYSRICAGQSNHPARQHHMLGFVLHFAIQNCMCGVAQVFEHAKLFLPSKLSYLLFFSSHKTKTGIAMRSETTNNNSRGPIRLCGQWRGGVRFDSREKVRKMKLKKCADPPQIFRLCSKNLFFCIFLSLSALWALRHLVKSLPHSALVLYTSMYQPPWTETYFLTSNYSKHFATLRIGHH